MKHETAEDLAHVCFCENQPIDWHWIRSIRQQKDNKEMLEWAKGNIELFAYDNCSKNKITRAAKILLKYLHI